MNKKAKSLISTVKSLIPSSNIRKVFKQLGSDENGVPYHLHILNNHFETEEQEQKTLEKYKELALSLRDKPKTISELICNLNWRPTLVGNAVVILLQATEFQKDLIWRLENRSWVSPQLAVGIALIDQGFAEKELIRIIEESDETSEPKTIMSAYSSLKFLESPFTKEFEKNDLFEIWKEKDSWDNSAEIAIEYWNYWKNVKPII